MKTVLPEKLDAPSTLDGISMMDRIEARAKARRQRVPTEEDAFRLSHDCFERLKELGWREIQYCPKDGTEFDAYCFGDLVSFDCTYEGQWPDGMWVQHDEDDSIVCYPSLWRPKSQTHKPARHDRPPSAEGRSL